MTIIIIVLICFLVLNIIHHLTIIEQLKAVKRNQNDLLDYLEDIDMDYKTIEDDLTMIKQSINNIAYQNIYKWVLNTSPWVSRPTLH